MSVRAKIDNLKIKRYEHIDLYLFGSSLFSENPNDIDLAIIYDKRYISIEDAINYRLELEDIIANEIGCFVDTILLSIEEENEAGFLEVVKHKLI